MAGGPETSPRQRNRCGEVLQLLVPMTATARATAPSGPSDIPKSLRLRVSRSTRDPLQAVAIVEAFYGKGTSHNYFNGCSDGGREALMEAQRFADDFDGIIAGAPPITGHTWSRPDFGMNARCWTTGGNYPQAKLPAIQRAAVEQCDALDGVKDGLIEDPRACHFDPGKIACKGADSPECLTAPQIGALRKIYGGPKNPRTGAAIYPGNRPA